MRKKQKTKLDTTFNNLKKYNLYIIKIKYDNEEYYLKLWIVLFFFHYFIIIIHTHTHYIFSL
jgi:hypothetical protein